MNQTYQTINNSSRIQFDHIKQSKSDFLLVTSPGKKEHINLVTQSL